MMHPMSEPTFELRKQIKTTAVADSALGEVVSRLKGAKSIRWKGKRVTQEAVVNAAWLWLKEMPGDQLEEAMAQFVPRLEALMRGEPIVAADLVSTMETSSVRPPKGKSRKRA